MSKLLILGAGGLGQMVGEVARAAGNWDGVAFLDDAVRGADVAGKCMDYTSLTGEYPEAVAAFGDNRLRLAWTRRLLDAWCIPQPSSARPRCLGRAALCCTGPSSTPILCWARHAL